MLASASPQKLSLGFSVRVRVPIEGAVSGVLLIVAASWDPLGEPIVVRGLVRLQPGTNAAVTVSFTPSGGSAAVDTLEIWGTNGGAIALSQSGNSLQVGAELFGHAGPAADRCASSRFGPRTTRLDRSTLPADTTTGRIGVSRSRN